MAHSAESRIFKDNALDRFYDLSFERTMAKVINRDGILLDKPLGVSPGALGVDRGDVDVRAHPTEREYVERVTP